MKTPLKFVSTPPANKKINEEGRRKWTLVIVTLSVCVFGGCVGGVGYLPQQLQGV